MVWSTVWHEWNSNDFGTDEYMELARLLGYDGHITTNYVSGTAQDAADWVEYTNGSADTPMGRLRAQNGYPEPYGIKPWANGNEAPALCSDEYTGGTKLEDYTKCYHITGRVAPGGVLMSNLKFAMLGAGFWARYQLAGWRELQGVECVAIFNRTLSKAQALAPVGLLLKVLLFGLGWGVGSVLFGLGVNHLGLAVGYGIILGLIAPIGTFPPLVVLHPERLWTRQGYSLIVGMVLVLIGILFLAVAGKLREMESASLAPMVKSGFMVGLVICILAGVFSPMLNFSFVFRQDLQTRALAFGATPSMASNAIWCLTLTAGFIANAGYGVYLL